MAKRQLSGCDTASANPSIDGVDRVAVPGAPGALYLCGLDKVRTDPGLLLDQLGADTLVCLLPLAEFGLLAPGYEAWLNEPQPHEALWLAIDDGSIASDSATKSLVAAVCTRLVDGDSVVVHCSSGRGRAGLIAALTLVGLGFGIDGALREVRRARPGAGPQRVVQDLQLERLATEVSDQFAL